jgi:hypothetical protein
LRILFAQGGSIVERDAHAASSPSAAAKFMSCKPLVRSSLQRGALIVVRARPARGHDNLPSQSSIIVHFLIDAQYIIRSSHQRDAGSQDCRYPPNCESNTSLRTWFKMAAPRIDLDSFSRQMSIAASQHLPNTAYLVETHIWSDKI